MIQSGFYKTAILSSAITAIAMDSMAQDATDVMRYSFINPAITARSMGIGSALGSLGGDFGSLSVNPAGIGIYRKGELMLTPSLKINSVNSTYLNTTNAEPGSRFNFNNLGVVFTRAPRGKRYDNAAWKSVSFAFGLNRLADFNRNYSYSGLMKGTGDNYSSFSEIFVNDAIQNLGNLDNNLGYQSYLIDADNKGYFTLANWETGLNQKRYVEERGGMNEILFSFGGNYREKLLLGATISLPTINYTRESYFQETDATNDPSNYFQAFRYNESLQTSGMGFTLKLGAIYKASDYFRLGAALHTPTWLMLSDVYDESITANTETYKQEFHSTSDQNPVTSVSLPQGTFDYTIRTPWRGVLSATGMLGKYGFITADYEYVDYKSARLGFSSRYTDEESIRNHDIRRLYRAASNFRVGIEGKLQNFFIRGGLGFYGSPFQNNVGSMNRMNISGGIGYRTDRAFIDIGFMHTRLNEKETAYSLPAPYLSPVATLENRFNNIAFTIGFKM